MNIIEMKIDELIPYENNPRINVQAVDAVAESIKQFGFKVPIVVDGENVIVAGHTRLKAANKLGLKTVPVIVASDLTPDQVKAFRLADNKVGELAVWDFEKLEEELAMIDFDMEGFGFDMSEVEFEGQTDEDEIPEEVEPVCKLGQIWKLGKHRLMCGDSTKKEDVEKLMAGEKADMVFTDPPYNVNIKSRSKKGIDKIMNDNMGDSEYSDFIRASFKLLYEYTLDSGYIYVWHNYKCQAVFEQTIIDLGIKIKNQIIWVKDIPSYSNNLYRQQHEICFYCEMKNADAPKGKSSSVWNVKSIQSAGSVDDNGNKWFSGGSSNLNLHVTQKPIELAIIAIEDVTKKNDLILDLFLGSGSTLIAAEKTNRICYGMELDPHYCDVIIKRWEDFTGNKAELIKEKKNND